MRTAAYSLNAVALAGVSLPAWLIWRTLSADATQALIGLIFITTIAVGLGAWGLALVQLCRPRTSGVAPLVLAGAAAFAAAIALLLLAR